MGVPLTILPQRASVSRKSNAVATATFPIALTPAATFAEPIRVTLQPSGLVIGVVITITGTLNGTPQTETVTLTASSGVIRSTKSWSTVGTIACATSTSGNVKVTFVYSSGEVASHWTTVHSSMPCRVRERTQPILRSEADGKALAAVLVLYANESDLAIDDVVEIDGTTYRVDDPVTIYDAVAFHHIEAVITRLGAGLTADGTFTSS